MLANHTWLKELFLLAAIFAMGFGTGWVKGTGMPTAEMAATDCRKTGMFESGEWAYVCYKLGKASNGRD